MLAATHSIIMHIPNSSSFIPILQAAFSISVIRQERYLLVSFKSGHFICTVPLGWIYCGVSGTLLLDRPMTPCNNTIEFLFPIPFGIFPRRRSGTGLSAS